MPHTNLNFRSAASYVGGFNPDRDNELPDLQPAPEIILGPQSGKLNAAKISNPAPAPKPSVVKGPQGKSDGGGFSRAKSMLARILGKGGKIMSADNDNPEAEEADDSAIMEFLMAPPTWTPSRVCFASGGAFAGKKPEPS